MCGIAGAVALRDDLPEPALEDAVAMISALRHRGPDEQGAYRDRRAILGHARLAIIDLATGAQPLANEDGSAWVVFNGEIYNHVELRAELEAAGHAFRTRSDTEVIVHAWEAWGEDAFVRFNGQFAIALWDARDERLVLARDRFGVRPLYLCEHGGRLWFASEVKALFAGDPTIRRAIDPAGLAEIFTFWTTVPPQTIFEGVTELEPGHVRTVGRGRIVDRAFWEPRYPVDPGSTFAGDAADAAQAVREALEEAVRLRMLRADVPVGCYVSGGLDSSLVAALGRRATGDRLQSFSLRFDDPEYDETAFQRTMVAALGSEHHEVVVTRRDIATVFPDVVWHAERPVLRTAPAPLFLLSRLVHETGIKVVLTGEGADEVFAGYDLFREGKVRRFWGRQPASTIRPLLLDRLYPYLARSPVRRDALAREYFGRDLAHWRSPGFAHAPRWRSTAALQRLFTEDVRRAAAPSRVADRLLASLPTDFERWSHLAQDQYLEMKTLLAGYLLSAQGDRMLMAHAVEGRFPFLDPDLVDLANSLPSAFKLRGLDAKHVLKRAGADIVPATILRRPKQPYRAPDAHAFSGPDRPPWTDALLAEASLRDTGLFDPAVVARLWRKCREQPPDRPFSNADNMALVGILSTELLHSRLVRAVPERVATIHLDTLVDRTGEPWPGAPVASPSRETSAR